MAEPPWERRPGWSIPEVHPSEVGDHDSEEEDVDEFEYDIEAVEEEIEIKRLKRSDRFNSTTSCVVTVGVILAGLFGVTFGFAVMGGIAVLAIHYLTNVRWLEDNEITKMTTVYWSVASSVSATALIFVSRGNIGAVIERVGTFVSKKIASVKMGPNSQAVRRSIVNIRIP